MTPSCPASAAVGGYLLGVLRADETEEFRRHTATCRRCRSEIAQLAPVAKFLAAFKAVVRVDDMDDQFDELAVLLGYAR